MSKETKTVDNNIKLRVMTRADLPDVSRLEQEIFSDPWPFSAFEDVIKEHEWGGLVAEIDNTIIAYATYLIVDVESHLTNIAVDPSQRRKSVAKQLLDRIFTIVEEHKCEFLLLEVRPSNTEALAFYELYGFRVLYQRPNYYRRPVEDALVMVRYF